MNKQRCIVATTIADFLAIAHFITQQHAIVPCANYTVYSSNNQLLTTELLTQLHTVVPANYTIATTFNDSDVGTVFTTHTNLQWVQQYIKLSKVLIIGASNATITNAVVFAANTTPNVPQLANVLTTAVKTNVISLTKGNSDFEVMQTAHIIAPYIDGFRAENRECFSEIIKNEHSFKTCEEIINYYAQKVNSNFVILSHNNNLIIELLLNKSFHIMLY